MWVFLLATCFLWHQAVGTCRDGWVQRVETCYLIVTDFKTNWATAEGFCETLKGSLAEVKSMEIQTFLQNQTAKYGNSIFWLGGNDIEKEGVWRWTRSDELLSGAGFQFWSPGEPTNLNLKHHHEDCLIFGSATSFRWNDGECTIPANFICERDASGGPAIVG